MAGTGKSTVVEMAARVDTVMTMLLRGEARPAILQHAANTWHVADRTSDMYIARATALIEQITQPRKEYEFALVRTRLEDLYMKTLKDSDYKTSLAVLKQIAEMTGINAPTQVDIQVVELADARSDLARRVAGHAAAAGARRLADDADGQAS